MSEIQGVLLSCENIERLLRWRRAPIRQLARPCHGSVPTGISCGAIAPSSLSRRWQNENFPRKEIPFPLYPDIVGRAILTRFTNPVRQA